MEWSKETSEYIHTVEKDLEEMGVLKDTDHENLHFLGDAIELYHRAIDQLDREGFVVTDAKGRKVAHPAFSVLRSQQAMITSLFKELSISTRQRRMLVKDDMVNEESPLSQLFDMA